MGRKGRVFHHAKDRGGIHPGCPYTILCGSEPGGNQSHGEWRKTESAVTDEERVRIYHKEMEQRRYRVPSFSHGGAQGVCQPACVEDAGCVAILRGPVVYCLEGTDNGELLQSLRIPKEMRAEPYSCEEGILKGNTLLKIDGFRMVGSRELYSEKPPVKEKAVLTAIPYYAWTNRGENQMRVWIQEE